MIDPFVETLEQPMSRVSQTTTGGDPAFAAEQIRRTLTGRHVCPYCGHQYAGGPEPCPRCTMEDTPATRQATKARLGPWYVLQSRNPSAPGMKFATLLALINKNHVTPRSIIRGPTTYQLWRFAAHVRGVSREFGLCYSCGGAIERTSSLCAHCQRSQEPPGDPDVLLEARSNGHLAQDLGEQSQSYAARLRELNRPRPREHSTARDVPLPINRGTETVRKPDSRVVSAMELASALQDRASETIRAPLRMRTWVLLILVLLAGGAAAMLYLRPDYRQTTVTWLNESWTTVKTKVASIEWSKPKPAGAKDQPPVAVREVSRRPVIEPVKRVEPPPRAPEPVVEAPPTPPPAKPANPQPTPSVSAQVDPEVAMEQARNLWSRAIDAEGRQDFAEAARLYEQIKRLPLSPEYWPGGLQNRLEMAQKQIGQSSAR